jgi:hypothetical protein
MPGQAAREKSIGVDSSRYCEFGIDTTTWRERNQSELLPLQDRAPANDDVSIALKEDRSSCLAVLASFSSRLLRLNVWRGFGLGGDEMR